MSQVVNLLSLWLMATLGCPAEELVTTGEFSLQNMHSLRSNLVSCSLPANHCSSTGYTGQQSGYNLCPMKLSPMGKEDDRQLSGVSVIVLAWRGGGVDVLRPG